LLLARMMRLPLTTTIDLPQEPAPVSGALAVGRRASARALSRCGGRPRGSCSEHDAALPEGCAAGNIAIERTAAISIVFRALTDPRTNGISVADR